MFSTFLQFLHVEALLKSGSEACARSCVVLFDHHPNCFANFISRWQLRCWLIVSVDAVLGGAQIRFGFSNWNSRVEENSGAPWRWPTYQPWFPHNCEISEGRVCSTREQCQRNNCMYQLFKSASYCFKICHAKAWLHCTRPQICC
jgi:hypothetical protein